MFESELKLLFKENELLEFYEFRKNLTWFKYINSQGNLETYWHVYDIQVFINYFFNEMKERKEEVINICVNCFPQIIGIKKENV